MRENQRYPTRYVRRELNAGSAIAAARHEHGAQQQLSITDICETLLSRKVAVLSCAATIFCLVAAYTFLKKPVFEGVSRVQIDLGRPSSMGFNDSEKWGSPDLESRVKTEVSIIQSGTVAMQVMKSLKLYANRNFAESNVAYVTEFSELTSSQRRRLLDQFDDSLTVRVLPDTQVIEIHFRNSDPALASAVANSIVDEYMQRNFRVRTDATMQVSEWLSKQLEEVRASTDASQRQLAEFQRRNNFLGADESDNIVIDRLKQLNDELTQAEADRIVKEGRYRLAESGNPELITSIAPGSTLQTLHTQEADLQAQYAEQDSKFGNGYPKVRELRAQLDRLHSAIDVEKQNIQIRLANEYDGAVKAEAMVRNEFANQKEQAYKLNVNVAQYAILKHGVESGQRLYDTLQFKLKEAGITSGLASSYVSIIDRAEVPDKAIEPKKMTNLGLGLGAGLFGGVLLAFALDSFDKTVRDSQELEGITGLPELASVPFMGSLALKHRRHLRDKDQRQLSATLSPICVLDPACEGTESYRTLCSSILLSGARGGHLKVILVTSALVGEGKSTISYNLAAALAQRGKQLLLIDADLRCSTFRKQSGTGPSLSTILTGSMEYPFYSPVAHLPNLHVVPAGGRPVDPTQVLDSARMEQFMAASRARYDHIIIDTPPVLPFPDAMVLSARADGVILVTRSQVSRADALLRAQEILARCGARILGFVLNAVRRPPYYYSYPAEYMQVVNRKSRRA